MDAVNMAAHRLGISGQDTMCIAQPRHELRHHGAVTAMVFSLVLSSLITSATDGTFSVGCWTQLRRLVHPMATAHVQVCQLLFETTR